MKRNRMSGFTLVEIMVVSTVIGLLAMLAVPSFVQARANVQTTTCLNNLRVIDDAKLTYFIEVPIPDTEEPFLEDLVTAGYLRSTPACPSLGWYGVGNLNTAPNCSTPGHAPSTSVETAESQLISNPIPAPAPTPDPNGGSVGGGGA